MLRGLVRFVVAPFVIMFLYMLNMGMGMGLLIGGIYAGARVSIDLYGEVPTGADASGLFPAAGGLIGMLLAIGVCFFFMFGFFIPFVLNYLLSMAEDVAPAYKPVARRVEGYVDQAQKYFDER